MTRKTAISGHQRRRWLRLAVCLSICTSCGPPTVASNGGSRATTRLAPLPPLAAVAVERLAAQPSLSLLTRQDGTRVVIALAADTRLGVVDNALLAELISSRLANTPFAVQARAEGAGFIATHTLTAAATPAPFFDALASALHTPVSNGDNLDGVTERLAALAATPLDHPLLLPVAGCGAVAGVLAKQLPAAMTASQRRQRTEQARRHGLSHDRLALALIGSPRHANAVRAALRAARDWPYAAAPGHLHGGQLSGHGSYLRAADHAVLEISVWFHDAELAASLAAPSRQLPAKLAFTSPSLRLQTPRVRPRSRGGCARFLLSASAGLPRPQLLQQTSAAIALVTLEARRTAQRPTPFGVAQALATLTDGEEAAAAAARWALSSAAPSTAPVTASALGIPHDDARPLEIAAIDRQLTVEVEAQLATPAANHRRRKRVEAGETRLWLMIGNPCAVVRESRYNAGLATMTGLTFGGAQHGLMVESYVSAHGVGVLASQPLDPATEPRWQAQRFGRAVAAALLRRPDQAASTRAQHRWQSLRHGDAAAAQFTLAVALQPDHPSHLLPWASIHQLVPAVDVLQSGWRALLEGPWRIAALAPSDALADTTLAAAQEGLLPPREPQPCGEARHGANAEVPHHVGAEMATDRGAAAAAPQLAATRWWLGIPLDAHASAQGYGWLGAAWLSQANGAFRKALTKTAAGVHVDVQLMGAGRERALLVQLHDGALTQTQVLDALAKARASPPAANEITALLARTKARRVKRLATPRARLVALWSGDEEVPQPDARTFRGWWARSLAPAAVKRVSRP